MLKIHSLRGGRDQTFGHSWLEYCPADGVPVTYGTWGNNPSGEGNGLLENTEQEFQSDASRAMRIDQLQEQRLFETISQYRNKGALAWTLFAPCSTFAAETWENVTGERLRHHTAGISNPTQLVRSIVAMNKLDETPHVTMGEPYPRPPGAGDLARIEKAKRQGTKTKKSRSKGRSS